MTFQLPLYLDRIERQCQRWHFRVTGGSEGIAHRDAHGSRLPATARAPIDHGNDTARPHLLSPGAAISEHASSVTRAALWSQA